MTLPVEILVPEQALPTVKDAFGALLPSTALRTRPSQRISQRLIISPLNVLDTPRGRTDLEDLLRSAAGKDGVSLVLFALAGAVVGMAVAAALTRVAWKARVEPFVTPSPEAVRRIVLARRAHAEKALIASAAIEDRKLVVWSCEPVRLEVPVSEIPALARLSTDALGKLELSPSGSRIRWSDVDIDLDLDTIRAHADPEVRREHQAQARREAARYADAIRQLREERGLKQSEIGGLTDRQVRRLEKGHTVPQIDTLKRLATAHGMAMDDYLRELATRSRRASRRPTKARRGREARSR